VFPLIGAEYDLYFGAKREDDGRNAEFAIAGDTTANAMDSLSAFSFKFGLGGDVFFTEHLFLRGEILYGIRLKNKQEKYALDQRSEGDWLIPHGGSIKFAIGWQF
jgi:hypothetical protein